VAATEGAEHLNVILITIDCLRADHIGAYGYDRGNTPNMDALATQGLVFEQATAQTPWTLPSFASLFTSMYPTELNLGVGNRHIGEMQGQRVDDVRVTLAEVLQTAGYRTQAIVTNPWLTAQYGFAQGFDGFLSVDRPRPHHLENMDSISVVKIARQISPVYQRLERLYAQITGDPGQPLLWDVRADRVTAEATAWLRANRHEPFFLWVHYIDPHYPFNPPEGYRPTVDGVAPERMAYLSSYNEEEVYTGRARLRPQDKAAMVALYDGEIAYNDHHVGQLLAEVDALGYRDNSLVMLTADHGDEFWEHGGYQHGHSLYDELIHVPLIVRGPGLFARPRRIADSVQHLDIMPTLLDLVGGTTPMEAQGQSLLPLLRDESPVPTVSRYTFAEALFLSEERKAIRGEGLKLIYLPFSEDFELYDLVRDPGEQHNLSTSDPDTVERLFGVLKQWLLQARERGAVLPRSNNQVPVDPKAVERLLSGGY
jgi:arylsulfatase A-like enzyme